MVSQYVTALRLSLLEQKHNRFAMLEMTEDKQEAHQAWRERRKPRFKGS